MSVLVGIAGYFSVNIGLELQGSKGYLAGVRAAALAEAGLAHTIARIKKDVRSVRMFDPDILDKDKTPNPSKFPDLVHKKYSTRAEPSEGVWGDDVDSDSDGKTATDIDEMVTVNDKGTPASLTDDDGYYVLVRDANARVDLNALTSASVGLLAQFPSIRAESLNSNDAVAAGSIADRIITGRASLPNGKYTTVDQLRSVLGKEDFQAIKPEIDRNVAVAGSSMIVSGGLVARYYGLDRSGSVPKINYDDFKGMVIDHGTNAAREYGENVFSFNSAVDFAFKTETNDQGVDPVAPSLNATQDFAVIWTGYVFIPNTTPITFLIDYKGGLRMRIRDIVLAKTNSHWNPGNSGEVVVSVSLPAGWHPVLIEYYSTGSPHISIHWNGGYHYIDPNTGSNTPSDPDVDLRTSGGPQGDTRMPMASFGFKSGGIYEITSTGIVRDKQGRIQAQKTITSVVRIWDYIHESTTEDFSREGALVSHVTFDDSCPLHPIGDTSKDWSLEFNPTTKLRKYDTIYNAIKLGYWENFDDPDFIGSSNPLEAGVYPFYDAEGLRSAWKGRETTVIKFLDADGDGDRELVITSNADASTVEPRYYADLVGKDGNYLAPISDYTFTNIWYRFDEDDNRGPLDRENYEDQSLGLSPSTDFDGQYHNAPRDPEGFSLEDHNRDGDFEGDNEPGQWWVGWGNLRFNNTDNHFGIKQEGFGPGEDPNDTNTSGGHEFETRVNGVIEPHTKDIGYTYKKTFAIAAHEDDLYYYKRTPYDSPVVGFPPSNTIIRSNEPSVTGPKTVGFYSWGNESARPRHIDNVRIIPVSPSIGTFTSAPSAVDELKEWGTVNFTTYQDAGSQVTLTVGPEGNPTASSVTNGALLTSLGDASSIQYSVSLSMDLKNASGNVELNYRQPVFADITMTYLVEPDTIYYREE